MGPLYFSLSLSAALSLRLAGWPELIIGLIASQRRWLIN
jgi:hypothetical protein